MLAVGVPQAEAATCPVDGATLHNLYSAVFHRPPDEAASAYIGHDAAYVLGEMMRSEEHLFYTDVFVAVKEIETARRNGADSGPHYSLLGSALGMLETWAASGSVTDSEPLASGDPSP